MQQRPLSAGTFATIDTKPWGPDTSRAAVKIANSIHDESGVPIKEFA